jgi:hypothetical protein
MRLWNDNIKMDITEIGFVFRHNFLKQNGKNQYYGKTNQVNLKKQNHINSKNLQLNISEDGSRTTFHLESLVQNFLNR